MWLKSARKAVRRGERTADGLCVCEGLHLLEEALRRGRQVAAVFFTEGAARNHVERLVGPLASARLFQIPKALLDGLSSTETSQGLVSLVLPPQWTLMEVSAAPGPMVVLDGIQEPGNAGAIVRSAEAFGAGGVVFLKGTTSPFNPKNLRAAAGSLFHLPFVHDVTDHDLLPMARARGGPVFAAMPAGGTPVDRADLRGNCTLIFGGEGNGVRPALSRHAQSVRIPTHGVESLNAAVAAAVILYEALRQRMPA